MWVSAIKYFARVIRFDLADWLGLTLRLPYTIPADPVAIGSLTNSRGLVTWPVGVR